MSVRSTSSSQSLLIWGMQEIDPHKTVGNSLDKTMTALSYGLGLNSTDDLSALTKAIQNPIKRFRHDSMVSTIQYLGRIAALDPLEMERNPSPADVQLRNQQIDITLIFIAQQEAALLQTNVSQEEIETLRRKLITGKLHIITACLHLLQQSISPKKMATHCAETSRHGTMPLHSTGNFPTASTSTQLDSSTPSMATRTATAGARLEQLPFVYTSPTEKDEYTGEDLYQPSPAEKRSLCSIIARSRFAFDIATKADLVAASRSLARIVVEDPFFKKTLQEAQQYVFGKLANEERHQNLEDAVESLETVKKILGDDTNDLRFEHGSFIADAREGFRAWLTQFFGWIGSSSNSREAAMLVIHNLRKKADAAFPSDHKPNAGEVKFFF